MRFSAFIRQELDAIIEEWESFAGTLLPAASTMSRLALRDHSREILLAVAKNMETLESAAERSTKSKGLARAGAGPETAAAEHGALRHLSGFDLVQLVAEFRAMRASVLSLWKRTAASKAEAGDPAIEEITRFNEAIDQALAESVKSYSTAVAASRDMFLAVLGHDLRSPLSVMKMSGSLLSKPEMTAASRQQTAMRIQRASASMEQLITDLLEYTRARLGWGIPIERSDCALGSICEEALDLMRASHPEQKFDLILSGDLQLQADAPRIHQALANLLSNSVQHGDRREPISLRAEGGEDAVEMRVTNSGAPIPASALQTVFEPLVQAQSESSESHERSKTSLGLGLFIVREIALGHGGSVCVESTATTGTVFTLRLPRAERSGISRLGPASAP